MKKRMLALLLAALMLLSLAACGNGTQTDVPQTDTNLADGDEYHGELPFVKEGDEPVTITIGLRTVSNVTDYKDNEFTKWLEEQTGLNLEFIQFNGSASEAATQVSLMIASGEKLPDILHPGGISKLQADEYGTQGYFLDLKPYFEKYGYYHKEAFEKYFPDDPSVREMLMYGAEEASSGAIYCFATMEDIPPDTPMCHTWINQEWLDNLGLEAPKTLSELHDVLVAFRDQDPNGNGKKDEIPMVGRANSSFVDILRPLINAYIYWNSSDHFNVGEDGKLYTPYTTDEYRQALIYINSLVEEGLLSTLTWTQTAEELKSLINPANGEYLCGIVCGHASLAFTPDSPAVYAYEPLAPFAAETPLGGYGVRTSYDRVYATYITTDCEHPVEAFKLLDFMCSEEAFMRCRYGVPGVNWDYAEDDGKGPGLVYDLIGDGVYNTQNSVNWHEVWSIVSSNYYRRAPMEDQNAWEAVRVQKYWENYYNYEAAGQPDPLFTFVNYTQEESERRSEFNTDLTSYIKDRRAQFCTNVLDPRNDAQWQEYLDGLEALHYSEWLELAQAAYDRLPKN